MKNGRATVQARSRQAVQRSDRQSVQRSEDPPEAVQSAAGKKSTAPAVRVQAQIFRARLKEYLDGEQVVIVGDMWTPRAIVVTLQRGGRRLYSLSAEARTDLLRRFEAALDRLTP